MSPNWCLSTRKTCSTFGAERRRQPVDPALFVIQGLALFPLEGRGPDDIAFSLLRFERTLVAGIGAVAKSNFLVLCHACCGGLGECFGHAQRDVDPGVGRIDKADIAPAWRQAEAGAFDQITSYTVIDDVVGPAQSSKRFYVVHCAVGADVAQQLLVRRAGGAVTCAPTYLASWMAKVPTPPAW